MSKVVFTAGRVKGFKCPAGKTQAFLWDTTAKGLRSTPAGQPSYIFQSRYQDKTIRLTIGSPDAWTIPLAQEKARELQRQIDECRDPREVKAAVVAADVAKRKADQQDAVTVAEAWAVYVADRRPRWGDRHYQDHFRLSAAGGEKFKRGTGTTIAGPLYPLMALALRDLDAATIEAWSAKEAKTRPTSARLAWRLLKGFLTWCNEQSAYAGVLTGNPAKTRKTREAFGKPGIKQDALLREQLPAWFAAVRQSGNPTTSAYLQTLLLTGARPGEIMGLHWADINTQWRGLTIRDKVEGERVIPLTPYVSQLLHALPRRNEWVFASNQRGGKKVAGPIARPSTTLTTIAKVVGNDDLTLHGLRRSFKSLTEWLEIPAGVVAQLMGHKPSATAEKHYTVRPLDLLRVHHEKIEAWILEQAGVKFDPKAEPGKLRVVT